MRFVRFFKTHFLNCYHFLKNQLNYLKFKRQHPNKLPNYLLIGSNEVGKSSLIKHSGLSFSNTTIDKNNWANRQTTIIEIADKNGITKFLNKKRILRMTKGIIVALNLGEILNQDTDETKKESKKIQSILASITKKIKKEAPVWILITQCDLLCGFQNFFANINDKDLEDAFGLEFEKSQKNIEQTIEQFLFKH